MKRLFWSLVAWTVGCGALATAADAQTADVPALPVQVDLDHATFAYSGDASLLELYLAFDAGSLPFEPDSVRGYTALLPLFMQLSRSSQAQLPGTPDEPVWGDSVALNFTVPDTSTLQEGQFFIHQMRAAVPPGEYELAVVLPADPARERQELMLQRDVIVPSYGDAGLVGLSDVTLASSIRQSADPEADRAQPFYKNGLLVRPNPNQLFGGDLDRLYYYAEAYHLDALAGDDGTYALYAYVSEANQSTPVADLQRRLERPARSPDVIVGAFPVDSLPSGSYFLRLALLNEFNEAVAEQSRKFFVYNPHVQRERTVSVEASFENSIFATMPEAEVDEMLEQIAVIATDRERRRADGIRDLEERRRFLMQFWSARDPDPGTPANEFREEFYRRFQYANDRYSGGRREGWQTDRGRVLLKYGVPTAVDPHLYDRDAAPYEIWEYNNIPGEGQAIFVFADRARFGRFELLHSSVAGEPKLINWRQELTEN